MSDDSDGARANRRAFSMVDANKPLNLEFGPVVEKLTGLHRQGQPFQPVPVLESVIEIVENLRAALFPEYFARAETGPSGLKFRVGALLDKAMRSLHEQIRRGLCFVCDEHEAKKCDDCRGEARDITQQFLNRLPDVQAALATDVRASYEGDPAATSPDEAIFCYPGLKAITNYRLAHALHELGVPLIPRMIAEYAHSATGIDIHHGARIGNYFFIDHGTGVVIGETCRIGDRVRIYQGVTLGAKSFPLDEHGNPIKGIDRHPKVEDEVIIYSGATILGPVTIGKGSVIGGNVWLTHSVPPNSVISQSQAKQVKHENGEGI